MNALTKAVSQLNKVNRRIERGYEKKRNPSMDDDIGLGGGDYNDDILDDYGDSDYGGGEGDNYRWELFMEDVLEKFEHSLRGEKLNVKTGMWFTPSDAKPKLNDKGINDIMSDFSLLMNKATYLANIKPEYADEETKIETGAFINKLKFNYYNWSLDECQFESIIFQYARTIKLALSRPVGDLERRHRNKRFNKWGNNNPAPKGQPEEIVV